jgi:hypothetical protein
MSCKIFFLSMARRGFLRAYKDVMQYAISESTIRKSSKSLLEKQADEFLFREAKRDERKQEYPILTCKKYRTIRKRSIAVTDEELIGLDIQATYNRKPRENRQSVA